MDSYLLTDDNDKEEEEQCFKPKTTRSVRSNTARNSRSTSSHLGTASATAKSKAPGSGGTPVLRKRDLLSDSDSSEGSQAEDVLASGQRLKKEMSAVSKYSVSKATSPLPKRRLFTSDSDDLNSDSSEEHEDSDKSADKCKKKKKKKKKKKRRRLSLSERVRAKQSTFESGKHSAKTHSKKERKRKSKKSKSDSKQKSASKSSSKKRRGKRKLEATSDSEMADASLDVASAASKQLSSGKPKAKRRRKSSMTTVTERSDTLEASKAQTEAMKVAMEKCRTSMLVQSKAICDAHLKQIGETQAISGLKVDSSFVLSLSEVMFELATRLANDVTAFMRHRNRKTPAIDDVLLCARRNPQMAKHLRDYASMIQENSPKKAKKKTNANSKT